MTLDISFGRVTDHYDRDEGDQAPRENGPSVDTVCCGVRVNESVKVGVARVLFTQLLTPS